MSDRSKSHERDYKAKEVKLGDRKQNGKQRITEKIGRMKGKGADTPRDRGTGKIRR